MSREAHVRFRERLGVQFPRPTRHDCYNTLDTHWREDTGFWSRKGNGLLVCSLMRMIAYNILWLLRVVHFKSRQHRSLPWRQLRDLVRDALVQMRTRAKRLVLNLV